MPASKPGPRSEAETRRRLQRDYLRYSGLGLEFALTVGLLAGLGWLLDRWLGAFPVLLFAGTLGGMALGIYRMQRRLGPPGRRRSPERADGSPGGPAADRPAEKR